MKQLAAAADERWANLPRYSDSPQLQQAKPAMEPRDQGGYGNKIERRGEESKGEDSEGVTNMAASPEDALKQSDPQSGSSQTSTNETGEDRASRKREKDNTNPWNKARSGDNWQPESWSPGVAARR
jgi:NADH dehydrogenase [ubiquinone] 1 alpha subcomplex assembly factor 2